jgi:hypothetical protein
MTYAFSSKPGGFSSHGKPAAAEFAEHVLHMPGVVRPPTRLTPDAFEMPKAGDDFHLRVSGGSVASPTAYGRTPVGLSDCARLFVHAVDKEKTSRKPAVTRNETTVDQTVVSGDIGRIPCRLIFTV